MCKIKSICSKPQFSESAGKTRISVARVVVGVCLFMGAALLSSAQQTTSPAQQGPAVNQEHGQTPAPSQSKGESKKENAPPIAPVRPKSAGAPVDSDSYKVGPSDVLHIGVWNEPEFSGPVSVHEDGKITLPLVGDLQAGGKTPNQIEKIVSDALSKYIVNPRVTVIVQEVFSKKYYLDGEVNRPGEYQLIAPTTVLEAISKAGGLAMFANEKKIYVLRGDQRIPFNYKDVIRGKNMKQNILLKPGDHIFVP